MQNLAALKTLLSTPQNIVILPHRKPDADALGSCLAVWNLMKQLGHRATVVSPTDYPQFLYWMHGHEEVVVLEEKSTEKVEAIVAKADIIFCLDFSGLSRIEKLEKTVEQALGKAKFVLIDHHRGKEDFADFELWDITASSTCELVYDFIELLGHENLVNEEIGECLYAGIMTDTGSFKYPSTTGKTHRITANLMDLGINASRIHRLIFDTNSLDRLRFLGYVLNEKLVVHPQYHTAYFALSKKELREFNSKTGDTEGIVNYALSLENVILAALFIEKEEGGTKMSFRSAGDFSVANLARDHFNGGGHMNAAGGSVEITLTETVDKFEGLLPKYQASLVEEFQKKTSK